MRAGALAPVADGTGDLRKSYQMIVGASPVSATADPAPATAAIDGAGRGR
jgi:hypothetical protein